MADTDEGVEVSGEQTSAPEILESVFEPAEHEMERGTVGLLLSGLSAGLDIGFGPLSMAVLLTFTDGGFGDVGTGLPLASAYSTGFVFLIVARTELFTEHTTLGVMQVFDGPSQPCTDSTVGSVVITWGRKDRGTLPRQAKRALKRFSEAAALTVESTASDDWSALVRERA